MTEIVCPHCGAHYRVADEAIPPGGRDVDCARCGGRWRAEWRGSAPPEAEVAADVAEVAAEVAAAVEAEPATEPPPAPGVPPAPVTVAGERPGLGVLGWTIAVLTVAVAAGAAYAVATGALP